MKNLQKMTLLSLGLFAIPSLAAPAINHRGTLVRQVLTCKDIPKMEVIERVNPADQTSSFEVLVWEPRIVSYFRQNLRTEEPRSWLKLLEKGAVVFSFLPGRGETMVIPNLKHNVFDPSLAPHFQYGPDLQRYTGRDVQPGRLALKLTAYGHRMDGSHSQQIWDVADWIFRDCSASTKPFVPVR